LTLETLRRQLSEPLLAEHLHEGRGLAVEEARDEALAVARSLND
jgi:hypothetical protein